jgi:hypothetical protein
MSGTETIQLEAGVITHALGTRLNFHCSAEMNSVNVTHGTFS